jgi:hypothetical protein
MQLELDTAEERCFQALEQTVELSNGHSRPLPQ